MLERWEWLCGRFALRPQEGVAARLFADLERLYSTPGPRAYHSLAHVADCLRVFDVVKGLARDRDGVQWALWLHDCVYDPTRKDNEARSAEESTRLLGELGATLSLAGAVDAMIMATRHTGEPLEGDEALVADIDMSILASDPDVYRRYSSAVRAEYAFVSDADFCKGRAAFLESLLARAVIYHRDELRGLFEAAARRNMGAEIMALRS